MSRDYINAGLTVLYAHNVRKAKTEHDLREMMVTVSGQNPS